MKTVVGPRLGDCQSVEILTRANISLQGRGENGMRTVETEAGDDCVERSALQRADGECGVSEDLLGGRIGAHPKANGNDPIARD